MACKTAACTRLGSRTFSPCLAAECSGAAAGRGGAALRARTIWCIRWWSSSRICTTGARRRSPSSATRCAGPATARAARACRGARHVTGKASGSSCGRSGLAWSSRCRCSAASARAPASSSSPPTGAPLARGARS
eukprot:Amastigsp_a183185_25.p4 type:complete len:135 gc:universal Amastigsp_a183185_25:954-550(-)